MTPIGNNADASFYYHEDATGDVASMQSSAVYGNLADAMKDSTMLLPETQVIDPAIVTPLLEDVDSDEGNP